MNDSIRDLRIILASASPARLQLLRAAGLDPEVIVSGVDEDSLLAAVAEASPDQRAMALARAKADAVATRMGQGNPTDRRVLMIAADSMFEFDGRLLGKPRDAATARRRAADMSGRTGSLITGHHLALPDSGLQSTYAVRTAVTFGRITGREIDGYIGSGEPLHVAGGFTLDGLGSVLVDSISGDPSNVIGLSLPTLRRRLAELGVRWSFPDERSPLGPWASQ